MEWPPDEGAMWLIFVTHRGAMLADHLAGHMRS